MFDTTHGGVGKNPCNPKGAWVGFGHDFFCSPALAF